MGFEVKEFVNLGMDKDSVISKTENTFAFNNFNIRISSVEDSTALSVTNEKGPQEIECNVFKYLKGNKITLSLKKGTLTIKSKFPVQSDLYIFYYISGRGGITLFRKESSELSLNIEDYEDGDSISNAYISKTLDITESEYYVNDTYFTYYTEFVDDPEITGELVDIQGSYVGHCIAGEYFVLFTTYELEGFIYRFKLVDNIFNGVLLYSGNLGLNPNSKFETLYFYESEDIQKVYWVDGINQPRVINIMAEPNYGRLNNQYDFTPEVSKFPRIKVQKNYHGLGLFPGGTIQYFVSLYNKFGAETGIVTQSALQYLSFEDRGAKADEVITCSFDITLSNIDTSFDYVRVYSAKRSSINGPVELKLVSDTKIVGDSVSVIDTNINQETLDPSLIYFLGGEPFKAETMACKDSTLFLGNIEYINNPLSDDIKDAIESIIEKTEKFNDAKSITFKHKCFSAGQINGEYGYTPQIKFSSRMFKTFKRGEVYRFAIQFMNKNGAWTVPLWIGDKLCDKHPDYDQAEHQIIVPEASFKLPSEVADIISEQYSKYRILMAETSYTNRSILAQGVVCPTIFNYEERYNNKPFSVSSWIMRPRGGNASWMHFSDTKVNTSSDAEIQSLTKSKPPIIEKDGSSGASNNAIAICVGISKYKKIDVKSYNVKYIENYNGDISQISSDAKLLYSDKENYSKWKDCYELLGNVFKRLGLDVSSYMNYSSFYEKTPGVGEPDGSFLDKSFNGAWGVEADHTTYHFYIPKGTEESSTLVDVDGKKSNFYIDNSIVTFHSPEIEAVQDLVDNSNLSFRVVGIVPITASYSNASLIVDSIGASPFSTVSIKPLSSVNFEGRAKTLITGDFYTDSGWMSGEKIHPSSKLRNYRLYLWHKEGSINGQNENTFIDDKGTPFETASAKLGNKLFATQRFSNATSYIDYINIAAGKSNIFNSEELIIKKIDIANKNSFYYQGNYDKLLAGQSFKVLNEDNPTGKQDIDNFPISSSDPIRINYKSTPHIIVPLCDENGTYYPLPRMEDEEEFSIKSLYPESLVEEKDIVYPWNDVYVGDTTKCIGFFKCPKEVTVESVKELLDPIVNTIDKKTLIADIKNGSVLAILVDTIHSVPVKYNKPIYLGVKTITNSDGSKTEEVTYHINNSTWIRDYISTNYYNIEMPNFTTNPEGEEGKVKLDSFFKVENLTIKWKIKFSYEEKALKIKKPNYPYLYMCELYRNIPYNSLYGGYDENALEKLKWIPISDITDIYSETGKMEGDTYYQRWDCLKTYPFTEESVNKVVDITSFMVESHINLDGRCDINRGNANLLNCRPTNFNLMNNAYSQNDNIFEYSILDEKFELNKFSNQIVWSLVKSPTEEIDSWTGINANSSIYLDGNYGKVNKLVTVNDNIVAFQDKAISVINYNERTQLSTESGVPIEIQNSGRVNGYDYVSTDYGCSNKNSIVQTKSGVYFIDCLTKSFSVFNKSGIEDISAKGMLSWFRNNDLTNLKTYYDNITHDVYLIDAYNCLAYNEDLKRFSSFYPYNGIDILFNISGKSFIFKNKFYEMFKGDFCTGLDGENVGYSVEYRVNPDSYSDKTFTNIEFIADMLNDGEDINSPHEEDLDAVPFDKLEVWNSYQEGSTELSKKLFGPLAKKFRIWRVQIPRDNKSRFKHDRIRSPWIHLKLSSSALNKRVVFHNLIVKYFK